MKKLIAITFLCTFATIKVIGQQADTASFTRTEYRLVKSMLACQSMALAVVTSSDPQVTKLYCRKGNEWYEEAYDKFVLLQLEQSNLDRKLAENISSILQLYAKLFSDPEFQRKPEASLALQFGDAAIMHQLIPKLTR